MRADRDRVKILTKGSVPQRASWQDSPHALTPKGMGMPQGAARPKELPPPSPVGTVGQCAHSSCHISSFSQVLSLRETHGVFCRMSIASFL